MAEVKLNDLRSVRKKLGKSQSQMAELLGISVRAVQSYEQGWRPVPPYVQKLASLLLYWQWRQDATSKPKPCWKVTKCPPDIRVKCPAYALGATENCWVSTGNNCGTQSYPDWESKWQACRSCSVVTRWLEQKAPVEANS